MFASNWRNSIASTYCWERKMWHFLFNAQNTEQINLPICTKAVIKCSQPHKASENINAIRMYDRSFTPFIRTSPRAQTASNDTVILNCFFIANSQLDYRLEIFPCTEALVSGHSRNNCSNSSEGFLTTNEGLHPLFSHSHATWER